MVFDQLPSCSVLFVGASEICLKVLRYFRAKGVNDITLCNRTLDRSLRFAREEDVRTIAWDQLAEWRRYQMVVVGTKAPHYLLKDVQSDETRSDKQVLIDLSLPRNIDPRVGNASHILLYNIDQINHAVEAAREEVDVALSAASTSVQSHITRLVETYQARECRRQTLGC
jgi:glutamyl-tRNA reductase